MVNTGNTTLNQTPKPLYAVGVDIPINIDLRAVVNPLVFVTEPSHMVIAWELISKEGGVWGYLLSHEGDKRMSLNIGNDLGDHLTASLYRTNDLPSLPGFLPPI
jgi:hypothetical protein